MATRKPSRSVKTTVKKTKTAKKTKAASKTKAAKKTKAASKTKAAKKTKAASKTKAARTSPRKPARKMAPREAGSRRAARPEWSVPAMLVEATTTPDVVTVPARLALAIDGKGAPSSEAFHACLSALYGVAYTLKFARKKSAHPTQFRVAPLEGVWSIEGCAEPGTVPPPDSWLWRLRITVPSDLTATELADTVRAATSRKGGKLESNESAGRVFLEQIPEQRCGRILHVGPYADEPRSFALMQEAITAAGLQAAHRHVEIYLGDPRRGSPEKLKTVLLKELS